MPELRDEGGLPIYVSYKDVPFYMTYPSAWRQRGYAIIEGEEPIARLRSQLGSGAKYLPLYALVQCRRLRGQAARRRRLIFLAAFHGEDDIK